MNVACIGIEAGRSAAKIDMMNDRRAETDQVAFVEDRTEKENVLDMLTALVGVVVYEEGSCLAERAFSKVR